MVGMGALRKEISWVHDTKYKGHYKMQLKCKSVVQA